MQEAGVCINNQGRFVIGGGAVSNFIPGPAVEPRVAGSLCAQLVKQVITKGNFEQPSYWEGRAWDT
jgi:hypothetical protein